MAGGLETVLLVLFGLASFSDLRWGLIPNFLNFPFLIAGLAFQTWAEGSSGALQGLGSVALAFAIFFPLWLAKVWAAGDVKLLMAAAAWVSPILMIQLAAWTILAGAAVGLWLLAWENGLRLAVGRVKDHLASSSPPISMRMPFGPAFLCGFCLMRIAEIYGWRLL